MSEGAALTSHGQMSLVRREHSGLAGRVAWLRLPIARWRGVRPPRWWQEVVFIGACYALYTLTRNALPTHVELALARARNILHAEQVLHLDPERAINHFVAHVHWLAYISNYYYATMHFIITLVVLGWLYVAKPLSYRAVRSVLFAITGIALLGFWLYALAPPRMLAGAGFVDTVLKFHTWGSWSSGAVAKASNQYAAMPSLHIAWSLWCGITIAVLARRTWVRALGIAYPVVTLFVILGTANHFVADAAGGAIAAALGYGFQRLVSGRSAYAVAPARTKSMIAGPATSGASSTGK